ncbi:hypothetical protein ES332_A11G028400v1 [Gossypium tomentosum]|uniref:Uncharacterized protein n=1 Tax=Gossypium tomentosum TaxID=34277 RepID=A0A5D2N620_GOSTO|nr:hypothetical protein ES332_A11G028400v1 [Gossypium tomentosum]
MQDGGPPHPPQTSYCKCQSTKSGNSKRLLFTSFTGDLPNLRISISHGHMSCEHSTIKSEEALMTNSYLWELNPLNDPFIHDDLLLTRLNGLPARTVLEGGGKLDAVALVAQLDLHFDKRADSRLLRSFLQSCSLGSMSSRSCPQKYSHRQVKHCD